MHSISNKVPVLAYTNGQSFSKWWLCAPIGVSHSSAYLLNKVKVMVFGIDRKECQTKLGTSSKGWRGVVSFPMLCLKRDLLSQALNTHVFSYPGLLFSHDFESALEPQNFGFAR